MASVAAAAAPKVDPLAEPQDAFGLIKLSGKLWVVDLNEIACIQAGTHRGDVNMYRQADAKVLMQRYRQGLLLPLAQRDLAAHDAGGI